ncbi:pregnancy zone protein-like isoform X1 [Diabrotica virgifera virgifera]|uniref:Pregnancy zone protein-like isoform X1 n=1 Tax=Diabrotica virgifera virgifera TaxID=50390 RepID=A0A6P7G2E1_DIAVI|nr:pregnancy zone protein-like isoform X1 [Diabrotica virgifera virgifera]
MAKCYIFSIFLFHFALKVTTSNYTENQFASKNGGFIFSMPRVVVSGRNHTVCISLHDIIVPSKCYVEVKQKSEFHSVTSILNSENSCFELFIPKTTLQEPHLINVKVQVKTNGYVYSAHNLDPILVYPNKWTKTFIDTDREVYKPGDKIKFRILVVDDKLLPINIKIPKISISNPLDVTVAVWEDVNLENGLVSLEYEMVDESLVGKWKIESFGEIKHFEVSKYTLPRFKVNLRSPEKIYHETESFSIYVCGQYSYGQAVKGLAFIKITHSHGSFKPINRLKGMENGCGEFVIPVNDLNLTNIANRLPSEDKMSLHVSATVTEKGTNKIEVIFKTISIYFQPYTMKFVGESIFQPGLPYHGKLKFTEVNGNLTKEVVEICYNIAIKKSWNYVNSEQCSNFTLNQDNELNFQVLPMTRNVIHINFYARSINHTNIEDSFLVIRLFSTSNNYIQLNQNILEMEGDDCRADQEFRVTFTADQFKEGEYVTFYYMIKSGSHIYKLQKIYHRVNRAIPKYFDELKNIMGSKHRFSKLGTHTDNFTVKFKLDKGITSTYQFLVYYVSKTGETIAASKVIPVEPCLMKITASWNQKQVVPGATAQLNIKTSSQSLCSISAIDKSSTFLDSNNQLSTLGLALKSFYPEDRGFLNTTRKICVVRERQRKHSQKTWNSKREKRHVYQFSEDYDSFDIFNNFGSVVITNLKIVTKSCYQGPLLTNTNRVQFLTQQYESDNEDQVIAIRWYFPETWLWELVPVSNTVQLKRHLPHSITSYVTKILCVSETEGVGISNELEIVTFQSIFVEVLTPYTVKREESFYVYVHVSNYRSHAIPIRINILLSKGLDRDDKGTKLSSSSCVSPNDTFSYKLKVTASMLGLVNVSVLAETDEQFPLHCGPETVLFKRDSEVKSILVEAEGFRMRKTKSALLCSSETSSVNNNVSWYHIVPSKIVPGTYKSHISLNGDILGKTIDNLDDLLDMPTGCGEQIMATMAPNLYVLQYLNATNTLKRAMKQKILRNLKIGYQRILNYVHEDGSFSAFGYYDPMGSMFLTTFVVKILAQAREYIYVDQHVINKAVTWILNNQLENGCFNTMLHVFQDMGGTSKENSTASLTSYVIISLLEAKIDVSEKVLTNAKYCIRSQNNPDKYSLALNCYAIFKMKWYGEANKLLRRLLAVSEQHQNMLWWSNKGSNTSSATDIETTSYALMSLLYQNSSEHWAHALAVVRWLSTKLGPKGSFVTTQDTVVALEALSRYLRLVESKHLNLVIYMEKPEGNHNLTITNSDMLKTRRISMKEKNGTISVKVTGTGCVLIQVIQSFNLKIVPKNEAFKFALEVSPVSTINKCSITSLSPCISYNAPDGPSNMAVMEISLPTGYRADRSTLYQLTEDRNVSRIEMFEEKDDKVNFYFTKLDKHLVCFTFNINENYLIEERKNSLVKVYDYYNPEYEIQQFYNISEECKRVGEESKNLQITNPEIVQDFMITSTEKSSGNITSSPLK